MEPYYDFSLNPEYFPVGSTELHALSAVDEGVDQSVGEEQEMNHVADVVLHDRVILDEAVYDGWGIEGVVRYRYYHHHLCHLKQKTNSAESC